jgi:hypothetical protein
MKFGCGNSLQKKKVSLTAWVWLKIVSVTNQASLNGANEFLPCFSRLFCVKFGGAPQPLLIQCTSLPSKLYFL